MSQVVSEAAAPVASGQSESMRIGGYRQLFVDDHVVERRINCRREFNQIEKASFNPIIVCDKPWERGEGWYIERITLIDDPHYGLLRTWYETIKTYKDRPSETYMCYATSQDGVHWHKPNLGIVEFDGSKDNNIVAHPKSEAILNAVVRPRPARKRPITQVQESGPRPERSVHPQILG